MNPRTEAMLRHPSRTREYCLEVLAHDAGDAHALCDLLKKTCPVYVAGSSVRLEPEPVAYIRFRALDDSHAREIADEMSPGLLHTGYGAHRREV